MLSQDETRFSIIQMLRTTLGIKGHRPIVGNLDGYSVVYVFGALNLITGHLTTRIVERRRTPAKQLKTKLGQQACKKRLIDIAWTYPPAQYSRTMLVIDNAPWHKAALITEVLKEVLDVKLYQLPSYGPQLQVIERFWKVLCRRATHNRVVVALTISRERCATASATTKRSRIGSSR